VRQVPATKRKLLRRHVPQGADAIELLGEERNRPLALLAPLIVFAPRQLMADHRVAYYKPRFFIKRRSPHRQRAAIDEQRMTRDATAADELVHHAATHADEFVFSALTEERKVLPIERQAAEVAEREARDDLERRRGREA